MVFSMATNQNMKAFALSPRVTPLVFFLHYFLFFLYLTPFVTAYDKVQKSQLQEELSLVPAFGCHQNASDIFTQQRGKGKRKNQRQISQLYGHCVSSRARSSHVWRKEPVWPGNLGS